MSNEIAPQSAHAFQSKALAFVETAKQIEILDNDGYMEVGAYLMTIKANRKELDRLCDPAIEAAYLEHKARKGVKNEYSKPLDEAEAIVKDKLAIWAKKAQAIIDEKNKALANEARIKAEKEQAEKVAALNAAGKSAAAKKLEAAPVQVKAIEKIESLKAAGVTITQDWDGEVTDLLALLMAVINKEAPSMLVKEVQAEVRRFAQATKGQIPVPGIRFFTKDRVTARS